MTHAKLANCGDGAKGKLREMITSYGHALIDESVRESDRHDSDQVSGKHVETAANKIRTGVKQRFEAMYIAGPAIAGFAASTLYSLLNDAAATKDDLIFPGALLMFGCVLFFVGLLKH